MDLNEADAPDILKQAASREQRWFKRSLAWSLATLAAVFAKVGASYWAYKAVYTVLGTTGAPTPDQLSSKMSMLLWVNIISFALMILCGLTFFFCGVKLLLAVRKRRILETAALRHP